MTEKLPEIIPQDILNMMVTEYEGDVSADHVYSLLCEVIDSHTIQTGLLTEAKNALLEILVHAEGISEECKGKARAFVKSLDEKVKNGQQQYTGVSSTTEVPESENTGGAKPVSD